MVTPPLPPVLRSPLGSMAAVVIVAAGLKLASSVVAPLLLAIFITLVSAPLLSFLEKRMPFVLAVLAVVLVDVVVLAGFVTGLAVSAGGFASRLPVYQQELVSAFNALDAAALQHDVPLPEGGLLGNAEWIFTLIAAIVRGLSEALWLIALVIILVIFMLVESTGLASKLEKAFGTRDVGRFRRAVGDAQAFLKVKTLTSLATAALVTGWLWAMGVDTPLLWGLIAFALNYIPTLGSLIAGIPPIAVAFLQGGAGAAFAVTLGYAAINVIIGNLIEPRLVGRTLNLSPLVVLLSMLAWGYLLGPIGALLSAPLTVVARVFLANSERLEWLAILLAPGERERVRQAEGAAKAAAADAPTGAPQP